MKRKLYLTIKFLCILSSFFILLSSCTNPLLTDPRMYNQSEEIKEEVNPMRPNVELDDTLFNDVTAWYNNPNCNGDELSQDKTNFPNTDFDTIALTSWFNVKNVPKYEMEKKDVWNKVSKTKQNEYIYNGPNTKSKAKDKNSGFPVTNVVYHNYKGYNPLYDAETNKTYSKSSTDSPLLERFYFYNFTGICVGQNLDNYLIAIDTYSKFVFAFAKPTSFDEVLNNKVPKTWGMIDEDHYFFEYDPVGYVSKTEDGNYEIVIYKWFEDNLSQNIYDAVINSSYKNTARKDINSPGHSPFYKTEVASNFVGSVSNSNYSFRDDEGRGNKLYSVIFNEDGTSFTVSETIWKKESTTLYTATIVSERNKNNAIYKKTDGTELSLTLTDDLSILTVDKASYTKDFDKNIDIGPTYENRIVTPSVFKPFLGKTTLTLNIDKSILFEDTKNSVSTLYTFVENSDRNLESSQAIYKDEQGLFYGVILSNNDSKLSITNSAQNIESIDWSKLPKTGSLQKK